MRSIIQVACFLLMVSCQPKPTLQRESDFNKHWKFSLEADSSASQPNLSDENWQLVNLPHDWSVEFPFDTINGEGCTGYLPGGTGWYRKQFDLKLEENQKAYLLFDGVYNNSELWLNNQKLGEHPYGYTPFYFDLTPLLSADGQNNLLAVKVDRTRYADSRWYTGSGIYRNVKLIVTNKLHIPIWGTFVTTPEVSPEKALVNIEIDIANDYPEPKTIDVITEIFNGRQELVATLTSENVSVGQSTKITQKQTIENPELWDVDTPNLYTANTILSENGNELDRYQTSFGIRSIKFEAANGFFLNGKNTKIKGVCLHHDGGLVGAAVPDEVWRRRLQILKDGGCNAIRMSHNPSSEALLTLCDEMGFLVQDEFFDEWDYPKDKRLNMEQRISTDYITEGYTKHFQELAEQDLKTTVLAHRNHPSIFQWSIGNEIEWTYPRNKKATGFWDADWSGNYFWNPTPLSPDEIKKRYDSMPAMEHTIGETAQKLSKWTKELDPTRPVVANCILPSASYVTGYADALDVIGFSYRRVMYDYGHQYFPEKPIMGTENVNQWQEWKAILERPFVSGTFTWTGIDYMGEAHQRNPGDERKRGTASGLLDFAGFKKPAFFMMRSLWNETDPTLYLSTQKLDQSIYKVDKDGNVVEKVPGRWEKALWIWHKVNNYWNYADKEPIVVEVISSCPEVELFLNGNSLGTKNLADFPDRIYKWLVPYENGKLEAVGVQNGQKVTFALATAEAATKIDISTSKTDLDADGYDVAHIVVQLTDEAGNPVRFDEKEVEFSITGDVELLGVDNGNDASLQTFQTNKLKTSEGRALLIVRSTGKAGRAQVTASFEGAQSNTLELNID
ncbi:glycoside hydrolase family 2 TIM barrel-domain containing protein [Mangrovibacterium sp.]|uniref:glycoside hydrolase family 2 TIM barrel-domain containing protein n=1 Tax=Mangrovibacterium sp. TaxID=1961364 RepID=UPI0035657346